LELIEGNFAQYGTYHFSNLGEATWFDFAVSIIEEHGLADRIHVGRIDYYPTFARRPKFSILDVSKISQHLSHPIPKWQESLRELVNVTLC